MTYHSDEWAPITDADLLGDEELAPVQPPTPPPPLPPPPPSYPPKRRPIYTSDDWRIFNYWVRRKGFSIDMAAACAGIDVYDALVALQERDPWFYEFAVMIGPQGGAPSTKRRRGYHMNVGGQGKNYERTEKHYKSDGSERQGGHRLTEEEARLRFLALLGGAHPEDRVDGVRDSRRRIKAVHPATGRERLQAPAPPKKRQVRFTSRKCRQCGGHDHDRRNCKDLRENGVVPAGLENETISRSAGYEEESTVEERE